MDGDCLRGAAMNPALFMNVVRRALSNHAPVIPKKPDVLFSGLMRNLLFRESRNFVSTPALAC